MKRRVFVVLLLVLGLGLFAVPAAGAQSPEHEPHTLIADGDGLAMLLGKGVIDLSGNGILWVKAPEGASVEVTGYGQQEVFPDGWQQYAGFHGTAHIEGRGLRVILAGVDVHLEARGRGRAFLWGHGTHQWGDRNGEWSSNGLGASVSFTEPASQ
ncbi:MAG: hypothetical protein Kow0063_07310 [Anaerolineae bacterium]